MPRVTLIPYVPRSVFVPIHAELEKHRYNVLIAHRRMGKSVGLVNHMIKMAMECVLSQPRYAFIFPQLNQAKSVIWEYVKYYCRAFPEVRFNESELYVEFYGRRITLFGADNPERMRGQYFDGVVLDEYAQIKPDVWNEIVYPALTDRKGWVVFSGTPHGMNHFYDVYEKAKQRMAENNPLWWCGKFTIHDTGIFSADEQQEFRDNMPENKFRQEYECDFDASDDDVCIPLALAETAAKRKFTEDAYKDYPIVFGIDVARFGGDSCVITIRQGKHTEKQIRYKGINNMDFADKIAYWIDKRQPDIVFIDAGRGEGVIDRLRQMGYTNIVEVNFGAMAIDSKHYENRRAEMWDKAKEYLQSGGDLPGDLSLLNDLATPTYFFSVKNRMQIESKEKIKERIGRSPDSGDSFVLTFAAPVHGFHKVHGTTRRTAQERRELQMARADYNPLQSFNRPYAREGNRKGKF